MWWPARAPLVGFAAVPAQCSLAACVPQLTAGESRAGMRAMDATETISGGRARPATERLGIDSRASWAVAFTALAIYSVSFGAPYITVVALKPIAAELGSARSVPALAFALAWFGSAGRSEEHTSAPQSLAYLVS